MSTSQKRRANVTLRQFFVLVGIVAFVTATALLAGVVVLDLSGWVTVLVAVASLLVAFSALSRRWGVRRSGSTPDPERRNHVPVPGATLYDAVDQFRTDYTGSYTPSNRVRTGLRDAVTAVTTRFQGLSAEEAERRIEEGEWTDDPYAAAFLSEHLEPPGRSFLARLRNRFDRDATYRTSVKRTASDVAAISYTAHGDDVPTPRYGSEPIDEIETRTTRASVDGIVERASRETAHWAGIGVVSLVAIGLGAFAESPAIVMAGVVGVGYAGFANATTAPVPEISVARQLSDEEPEPGDEIDVAVTITNESGRLVPDLRFVDGVPAGLAVTDGTARLGTALRPSESVTLEYEVTARRGRHTFDPVLVVTRDLSRSSEREFLVESETTVVCEPVMRPVTTGVPLRTTAATFSGRLTTANGGTGTQFHSVREYRKNDPLNRIDWNRHARTGELATLEFHEERAARVLVLVDAREANYLAPEPDAAHAVDRSVDGAGRIAASLLDDGDTVGLAALGPTERDDAADEEATDQCWLAPGSGHHHRIRFQQLLATHPQFSTLPPAEPTRWSAQLETIHRRLSSETQIVFLTPLCDRASAHVVRWLDARGHAVTVVSPDPTADRTVGNQLARVARRIRRFDLQRLGIPIVEWAADETIDEAFVRVNAGSGGSGSRSGRTTGTDDSTDTDADTDGGSGSNTATVHGGSDD